MVRDRWYVILEASEVPRHTPVGVLRLGRRLVLWRDVSGVVQCVDEACRHRGASLALGRIVDNCVECPFHGFQFSGDGTCSAIPANGPSKPIPAAMNARSWRVCEKSGFVWLWNGDGEPGPIPWFDELDQGMVYAGFTDDWPIHYTRAVENQLDFTHLPFAHRTSIGRGLPGALDVITTIDGDRMHMTYDPATWDGRGFYVEFIAPGIWRNRLAPNVFAFIAFVPVDEANTRLYLRFYQGYLTVPVLGQLMCQASNLFNRYILNQDKRIVLTQEPRSTALHMEEVLLRSDQPIIAFRRWRDRLLAVP